jgi:hypothetical protein
LEVGGDGATTAGTAGGQSERTTVLLVTGKPEHEQAVFAGKAKHPMYLPIAAASRSDGG